MFEILSVRTRYENLLKTARRQFGQYKRMAGLDTNELTEELIFRDLYKPLRRGWSPNERNIEALQKRIDKMSVKKLLNSKMRVMPPEKPKYGGTTVNSSGMIKPSEKAFRVNNITKLVKRQNTDFQTETGEKVTKAIESFLDGIFAEVVKEKGEDYLIKALNPFVTDKKKGLERLVSLMYSDEMRNSDGTIKKSEFFDDLYAILETLGYSKEKAKKLTEIINEALKERNVKSIGQGITKGAPPKLQKG